MCVCVCWISYPPNICICARILWIIAFKYKYSFQRMQYYLLYVFQCNFENQILLSSSLNDLLGFMLILAFVLSISPSLSLRLSLLLWISSCSLTISSEYEFERWNVCNIEACIPLKEIQSHNEPNCEYENMVRECMVKPFISMHEYVRTLSHRRC